MGSVMRPSTNSTWELINSHGKSLAICDLKPESQKLKLWSPQLSIHLSGFLSWNPESHGRILFGVHMWLVGTPLQNIILNCEAGRHLPGHSLQCKGINWHCSLYFHNRSSSNKSIPNRTSCLMIITSNKYFQPRAKHRGQKKANSQ